MNNPIHYHVENNIGRITVNRPHVRNALNWEAQEQFAAAVAAAAADPHLRVLIVTGAGDKAFVSGGDLKELARHPDTAGGERLNRVMGGALAQLTRLPVPVIGAVNGDAVGGGCEILTACDLRLAAADARLRFVQVNNGLTTGWGGAGRLVRLLGQSRALELLLTGRELSAVEAHQIGFVHRLVEPEQTVMAAALTWAEELVALPRQALAALKTLVHAAATTSLNQCNALETKLFTHLWTQPDHVEAMAAFLEKRIPKDHPSMYEQIAHYYDLTHETLTADIDFILGLAAGTAGPLLELGCGSGRLLLPLARAGHAITGIDNSPAMLARARQRLAAESSAFADRITLVEADMAGFNLPGEKYGLALIGYNTLMHLPPVQIAAVLANLRYHLRSGGRFLIDLANPHALAQIPNDRLLSHENSFIDPATGEHVLQLSSSQVDTAGQTVDITWIYDAIPAAGGNVRRTMSQMRFNYLYPHQLELTLEEAGCRLEALYGSYDQTPFHEESERLIVIGSVAQNK